MTRTRKQFSSSHGKWALTTPKANLPTLRPLKVQSSRCPRRVPSIDEESISLAYSDTPLPGERIFSGGEWTPEFEEIPTWALYEMGILYDDAFELHDMRESVCPVDGGKSTEVDVCQSPTLSYCDVAGDEALETWAMEDDYVDLGVGCTGNL